MREPTDDLMAALRPFAEAGSKIPPNTWDSEKGRFTLPDDTVVVTFGNEPGPYASITYGDLRRAAGVVKG